MCLLELTPRVFVIVKLLTPQCVSKYPWLASVPNYFEHRARTVTIPSSECNKVATKGNHWKVPVSCMCPKSTKDSLNLLGPIIQCWTRIYTHSGVSIPASSQTMSYSYFTWSEDDTSISSPSSCIYACNEVVSSFWLIFNLCCEVHVTLYNCTVLYSACSIIINTLLFLTSLLAHDALFLYYYALCYCCLV